MQNNVLLLLCVVLIPTIVAVPSQHSTPGTKTCQCNTRARPGFRDPTCECVEKPTSFFDGMMIPFGSNLMQASMQAAPTNSSCVCEVVQSIGFKGSSCKCEAQYVPCPPHTINHPDCTPEVGFSGTVVWNPENDQFEVIDPETNSTVQEVKKLDCGDTGASWPGCECRAGYTGIYTWDGRVWNNNCTLIACPANAAGAPDCSCSLGYKPTSPIVFDNQTKSWQGTCVKVNCPETALTATHPKCACRTGYYGMSTFSFNDHAYSTNCTLAVCPVHASYSTTDGVTCECDKGYDDADSAPLEFDPITQSWIGQCPKVECPLNAIGHPECFCKLGYVGKLTWVPGKGWDGKCDKVDCPANAGGDSCHCHDGYVSSPAHPSWNESISQWTHTCTATNCPIGSSGVDITRCKCDVIGYVGSPPLAWTGSNWGSCKKVNCPPFSSEVESSTPIKCACNAGYTGVVEWNHDISTWTTTCQLAPCPINAVCNVPTVTATCAKGYAGIVHWSSELQQWVSTCRIVFCPAGALNHPNCRCGTGYKGGDLKNGGELSFLSDGMESRYQGYCHSGEQNQPIPCDELCSEVPCPELSSRNSDGSCTCDKGYAGEIDWDQQTQTFSGTCISASCPLNATGHGPTCACPKGFLPSSDFGFFSGSWHGQCVYQGCGANAEGWPDCKCVERSWFENGVEITWTQEGYRGQCIPWPCPANAEIPGQCNCSKGYATHVAGQLHNGPLWDHEKGEWRHTCEKVECPSGTKLEEHPNCACGVGYAGSPQWDIATSTWSRCTEIPCESDRNMISIHDDEHGTHTCGCKVGYSGQIGFSFSTQRWVGGCSLASCPSNAFCGADKDSAAAVCAKGFAGEVNWVSPTPTSGYWNASGCVEVKCPENSAGHPKCTCKQGFAGGELSFANNEYGTCTEVPCPENASKEQFGICACVSGFAGKLTWNTTYSVYQGGCEVAECVEHAYNAPQCECEVGYRKSADHGFSKQLQKWVGSCEPVQCPRNSEKRHVNCTCMDGYSGTLVWDAVRQDFVGQCHQAPCPQHSGGANCTCFNGYAGIAYWNGTEWTHNCVEVECPVGSHRFELESGHHTCLCDVASQGQAVWTGTEFDLTCQSVFCPDHSIRGGNLDECICETGYKGHPTWNQISMSYDGICDMITCPFPSIGFGGSVGCTCPAGFTGDCELNEQHQRFDCNCQAKDCPANAYISDSTKLCTCMKGFSGTLTWNEDLDLYSGSCEKSECVENAVNHPNCECETGFAGVVTWDDISDHYVGTCEKVQCPSFTEHHPICSVQAGYKLSQPREIMWDKKLQSWIGSVEVIPCPENASGAPNCKCNKGFVPDGLILVGNQWLGSCLPEPCTDGHPGFPDCKCGKGYFGELSWDFEEHSWQSTCQAALCPDNSHGALSCDCDEGWKGTPSWDESTQSWQHTCEIVNCPTNAENHPVCTCTSGYVGTISWLNDVSSYSGSCTLVPCPAHSQRKFKSIGENEAVEYYNTSSIQVSGVYKIKNSAGNKDFDAFVQVHQGEVWVKVAQWNEKYKPTSRSFGVIATSHQDNGKLADQEINSLTDNQGKRLYRFTWDSSQHQNRDPSESLYVITSQPHDDGKPSMGIVNPHETLAILATQTPSEAETWSTYTSNAFDGLRATPLLAGEGCDRLFMGIEQFDCNGHAGERCFNGGNKCLTPEEFPILKNVQVFVKLNKNVFMYPSFDAVDLVVSVANASDVIRSTIPGCECLMGCYGGYEFIQTSYEGSCTCVECPTNGDCSSLKINPLLTNTTYPCQKGFNGFVEWDGDSWNDNCVKVDCPSESNSHPNCACNIGYQGKVDYSSVWDSQTHFQMVNYTENCEFVRCPDVAMTRKVDEFDNPVCTCPTGYSGVAVWDSEHQRFGGSQVCSLVSCPDPVMQKDESLHSCVCPVGTRGHATWVPTLQIYQGDSSSCLVAPCPAGADCDHVATERKCNKFYSGSYSWDFVTQSWNSTCSVASCPKNSFAKSASDNPSGCTCLPGFFPAATWNSQTQSHSGCSSDASCPQFANTASRNETTGALLCPCHDGYEGIPIWDSTKSAFTHTCSIVSCPEGAVRNAADLCDCEIGHRGALTWSADNQRYLGSCHAAECFANSGVDCTFATNSAQRKEKTSLPCLEGYFGNAVWNYTTQEWMNFCRKRDCPGGTVRDLFPLCACKWGQHGEVKWDPAIQDYTSHCAPVACPEPTTGTGDGHCACAYATHEGTIRFTDKDIWDINCSEVAPCVGNSTTLKNGDCACNKGFKGTITTIVDYETSDAEQTSIAKQHTERAGTCEFVPCPLFSLDGSFPDCRCTLGFAGVVSWEQNVQEWKSTCQIVSCPPNASGAPECACNKGYLGTLTFDMNTQTWVGQCELATCPANAVSAMHGGVPSCKCANGYSGTQKWVSHVGWTHVCTDVPCPDFSKKITVATDVDYHVLPGFVGCHENGMSLGYVGAPQKFVPELPLVCESTAQCIEFGKLACQAIIDVGGDCWGFAVAVTNNVKMYSSLASDYSRCDPDNGLLANSDFTSYRRRVGTGDCQCVSGYGGGYIFSADSYIGGCALDLCPDHATCSTKVTCDQGYKGAKEIKWDFHNEKWIGTCSPVGCGALDDQSSFPSCTCGIGYAGGSHKWNFETESWEGTCTKVDCVTNSDKKFPSCRCLNGFVRSDGVPNAIISWSGENWVQTCKAVDCPLHSERIANGDCSCSAGYKGIVTFDMISAQFIVTQGSSDMKSCAKISCPEHSTETIVLTNGVPTRVCRCNDGYVGDLTWDFQTFRWGVCSAVSCPDHSSGHPTCTCDAGFAGTIKWNGKSYDGTCEEVPSTPTWGDVDSSSVVSHVSCHRLQGADSTAATPSSNGIDFTFAGNSDTVNLIRCDIKMPNEFTKIFGSYKIVVATGVVENTYQTVGWSSPTLTSSTRFLGFGTPFNIIDAGMESGNGAKSYVNTAIIPIPETSVAQTDVVRFEIQQAPGVQFSITDFKFTTYNMPTEIVKCVRTTD